MKKLLVRYIQLIVYLFICGHAFTQCIDAVEGLSRLATIQEDNTKSFTERITQLQKLQSQYLRCNKKDSVYARIAHRAGDFYSKTGDYEKAIQYSREAVAVNLQAGKSAEKAYLANSYFNLGTFYKDLYLFDESHRYFDSCIMIASQYANRHFILFMAYERKAYMYFQTGDYQKSIETSDKGILFAQKKNDSLAQAPLLSQKAQAQDELNLTSDAEQNIKQSIFLLEKALGDLNALATSYSIYAHLLNKKGNPQHAVKLYRKAYELNKSQQFWIQCSRNMLDLGYVYDKDLNDPVNAIKCYDQGIKIMEPVNDPYQLVGLYINKGVVYWRQKKYGEALQLYQRALNTLPVRFTDKSLKANPSSEMLKLVSNDYFVSTLLSNKGETLLAQYKIENKKEQLEAALATFQTADQSIDMMRWKQFGEQSKLFWREKTKKMYEMAIEASYLSGDIAKAYYFFEKSRAILLNDKLSELGAKRFLSATDRVKEQQLRKKISLLNQQLLSTEENSESYNSVKQELLTARNDWETFTKELEKNYPAYFQYKYDNFVFPLKEVKKKLNENNQSLIEYFNADSVLYILFISASREQLLKISYPRFAEDVKDFIRLCSDRSALNQNYIRYRTLGFQLYQKLFAPFNIAAGRVIISPDDYFIPFDALLSDINTSSSFLLKNYSFSYTYSMGLQMKFSEQKNSSKNSFLGVAPVIYNNHLKQQPLTGADISLNNIKPYFNSTNFLVKEDASKTTFLKSLPSYTTVQIYSHADADSSGKEPVLYLNDSAIYINEIQTLDDFQTQMVVLSACNTGVGKNARGEGIFSLARAFMSAGIPSTVTTLWQVDNKATYQLTESFYKYLDQGLPKDIALQKAKLEFLENQDKSFELPYYWAANIILGKTNPIEYENSSPSRIYFLVIISSILVALGIMFILKRKPKSVLH